MNYATSVLRWNGVLAMLLLAPASAMAQAVTSPDQPSEAGTDAIASVSEQQILPSAVEPGPTPSPASLSEAHLVNDDLDSTVAAPGGTAGVEGSADSTWVADSLEWLDQTIATQASLSATDTQADALGLGPSSTHSSDLQPMASSSASEGLFSMPLAQPTSTAQATSDQPRSEQWNFLFVPYVYVPFFITGSVNFNGTEDFRNAFSRDFGASGNLDDSRDFGASGNLDDSRDFEFTPSQIRAALKDTLNFAFFGGLEAWSPDYTLGFLTNVDYLSVSSRGTVDRSVRRPGFAEFIPTQINTALNTQLWTVDLAASYRFYDRTKVNPEGVDTEFDLGPFVFDVLGGLNLTSVNTQLGLNTNLGGDGEFTSSNTIFSPLLGGRFRWNANPKLAVLASGSVSGFGISGLMQYDFSGGVDWIFSGNTSLGVGYRFGFLDYTQSAGDFDLTADQNGPYINFGFRF
jgi:hypothetical protein